VRRLKARHWAKQHRKTQPHSKQRVASQSPQVGFGAQSAQLSPIQKRTTIRLKRRRSARAATKGSRDEAQLSPIQTAIAVERLSRHHRHCEMIENHKKRSEKLACRSIGAMNSVGL
jgi:hypothetical protein